MTKEYSPFQMRKPTPAPSPVSSQLSMPTTDSRNHQAMNAPANSPRMTPPSVAAHQGAPHAKRTKATGTTESIQTPVLNTITATVSLPCGLSIPSLVGLGFVIPVRFTGKTRVDQCSVWTCPGVLVGVVSLGQTPIGRSDLVPRCSALQAKNLVRINLRTPHFVSCLGGTGDSASRQDGNHPEQAGCGERMPVCASYLPRCPSSEPPVTRLPRCPGKVWPLTAASA